MGIALENRKRRLPSFSIEVEDLIDGRPIEKRCYFLKLPAGRVQETAYRNTMARRGRYRLSGFRLATKFPFGLLPRARADRRRGRAVRLPGADPGAGDAAARVAGPPGARAIVRAQPPGRVPRAARLPATATIRATSTGARARAAGIPLVREKEDEETREATVVLDNEPGAAADAGGVRARGLGGGGPLRRAGAPRASASGSRCAAARCAPRSAAPRPSASCARWPSSRPTRDRCRPSAPGPSSASARAPRRRSRPPGRAPSATGEVARMRFASAHKLVTYLLVLAALAAVASTRALAPMSALAVRRRRARCRSTSRAAAASRWRSIARPRSCASRRSPCSPRSPGVCGGVCPIPTSARRSTSCSRCWDTSCSSGASTATTSTSRR